MNPTDALYRSLETAYRFFNSNLFEGSLPEVLFTVQRKSGVLGYFAPDRWASIDGKHCHEIAINPAHIGQSRVIDVLQTLVHEMVHCWQYCHGSPSRPNYHNKEWAYKMIEIGLQPTSTGEVGGAITGQHMSDYPISDGKFIKCAIILIRDESFEIPWIDRLPAPLLPQDHVIKTEPLIEEVLNQQEDIESISSILNSTYEDILPADSFLPIESKQKSKIKYACPGCKINLWGKPELYIICGNCQLELEQE